MEKDRCGDLTLEDKTSKLALARANFGTYVCQNEISFQILKAFQYVIFGISENGVHFMLVMRMPGT